MLLMSSCVYVGEFMLDHLTSTLHRIVVFTLFHSYAVSSELQSCLSSEDPSQSKGEESDQKDSDIVRTTRELRRRSASLRSLNDPRGASHLRPPTRNYLIISGHIRAAVWDKARVKISIADKCIFLSCTFSFSLSFKSPFWVTHTIVGWPVILSVILSSNQ